jgi:beta-N-acetylhexosaminidase
MSRRWGCRGARRACSAIAILVATGLLAVACVPVPKGGAAGVLARMSLEQRVGQLFMVGTPATSADPTVAAEITSRHIGNNVLTSRSFQGIAATANVTNALQFETTIAATAGVPLLVAADQEGGQVQVLNGPGFSGIPSGLSQGSLSSSAMRLDAGAWGRQLRAAGVNVDLAPVMDTVPSPSYFNPPIGNFQREFGFNPATVAAHGKAFVQGMSAADVSSTLKHFPGLGRVIANTDDSSGVVDSITTRGDAYLTPFGAAINSGAQLVMMSTAIYSRIDPANPAAFSPFIINTILRGDLHFGGVVISDDLGAARQVAGYAPATRALLFIASGGDVVLTVDPRTIPAMYDAVLAFAKADPTFRTLVNNAALRVLRAKQARGLIQP